MAWFTLCSTTSRPLPPPTSTALTFQPQGWPNKGRVVVVGLGPELGVACTLTTVQEEEKEEGSRLV